MATKICEQPIMHVHNIRIHKETQPIILQYPEWGLMMTIV